DAGYAAARAYLDALLRELGLEGSYEAFENPSFTKGRAATFDAAPLSGTIGELHPEVIVGFGLDHPVAIVEVTLSKV
ncbi:MAG: phenylalanine--tRNA ligase subunit beta, partial [Myxococcota bacterium]